MYGTPSPSRPTSRTRATCSPLSRADARASRRNRVDDVRAPHHLAMQDLDRDALGEIHVRGREDDAHAAFAEPAFDLVLADEDRPGLEHSMRA